MLLPETGKTGALELAEQLRVLISAHVFNFEGEKIPVTISIGVATISGGDNISPSEFIKRADECLYQAKSAGRNCVFG
jgi:diguanylate cyclase (GGDEF)-like protein